MNLLKSYDYDRRKKGLPQVEYSTDFFKRLSTADLVYFRASCNLSFLSIQNPYAVLFCRNAELDNSTVFKIVHLQGDTIALQNMNNKFLSVKPDKKNILIADENEIGGREKFSLKILKQGDNQVAFEAFNKKTISVTPWKHEVLSACANGITVTETFRLYVLQK